MVKGIMFPQLVTRQIENCHKTLQLTFGYTTMCVKLLATLFSNRLTTRDNSVKPSTLVDVKIMHGLPVKDFSLSGCLRYKIKECPIICLVIQYDASALGLCVWSPVTSKSVDSSTPELSKCHLQSNNHDQDCDGDDDDWLMFTSWTLKFLVAGDISRIIKVM